MAKRSSQLFASLLHPKIEGKALLLHYLNMYARMPETTDLNMWKLIRLSMTKMPHTTVQQLYLRITDLFFAIELKAAVS